MEALLWQRGPICPQCGAVGGHYKLTGVRTKASKKNPEGVERHGLYKCGQKECRRQFTVRIGTIFEESHLPLHKWLQAIHLICSSKKGISANQLHRTLETTLKKAWFLGHRIREAMRNDDLSKFGFGGGIVESDETFIGNAMPKPKNARGCLDNLNTTLAISFSNVAFATNGYFFSVSSSVEYPSPTDFWCPCTSRNKDTSPQKDG